MQNRYHIKNIGISVTNIPNVIDKIKEKIAKHESAYICVTNSRTVNIANNNSQYCNIQNNSFLSVPDGMPLVWIAHNKGFKEVGKCSGKDLMDAIFKISEQNNYSHYFYGCSQETLNSLQEKLLQKHPNIQIKGLVSPPFQPIEKFDINSLAEEVNSLKPTFFWCGLGAPKQELLISRLQPKLNLTISVGVGLAFEYIAGTVKRAPLWMQKTGLEWFYRLYQQPKNISRAIIPLAWVFIQLIISFINKNGK